MDPFWTVHRSSVGAPLTGPVAPQFFLGAVNLRGLNYNDEWDAVPVFPGTPVDIELSHQSEECSSAIVRSTGRFRAVVLKFASCSASERRIICA